MSAHCGRCKTTHCALGADQLVSGAWVPCAWVPLAQVLAGGRAACRLRAWPWLLTWAEWASSTWCLSSGECGVAWVVSTAQGSLDPLASGKSIVLICPLAGSAALGRSACGRDRGSTAVPRHTAHTPTLSPHIPGTASLPTGSWTPPAGQPRCQPGCIFKLLTA